jgi:uncharacterized protein YjbJ (UPF0337 family)
MTKLQERSQGRAKQAVGQIVGNDKLVLEGKKQERHADNVSKQQSKEKKRAKNVQKGAAQKSALSEETRDPTGRKGPVLE